MLPYQFAYLDSRGSLQSREKNYFDSRFGPQPIGVVELLGLCKLAESEVMGQGIWSPKVPLYRAARATETCCFKRLKRLLRRVIVEQCRTNLPTLHDAQAGESRGTKRDV